MYVGPMLFTYEQYPEDRNPAVGVGTSHVESTDAIGSEGPSHSPLVLSRSK